ncbi:hypothetical protein NP493_241g05036 [Ridgeia piscesae]|uniref:Uncharacterized protein n=1 Tax=Ridgeia piscesae TaxID=27915 RepID=A0AAD9NZD0_RIDPI|nr:hypothetical protein NP493_241g05036 [Ridgeia piscesae]
MQLGCPASKLIVGIPLVASTYILKYYSDHGIGAGVAQIGMPGKYTHSESILAYYEVCLRLCDGSGTHTPNHLVTVRHGFLG